MIGIDLIKSILLLYIAMCGGFTGDIFGCRVKQMLVNSLYAKHLMLIFMIYFTVILTSDDIISPIDNLSKAIKVWIFYLMFIRLNLTFTIIVFIQFVSLFIIDEYVNYYTKKESDNIDAEFLEKIKTFTKYFEWIIGGTTIIGFIIFLVHRSRKRGKQFNILDHLLGDMKCKVK